MLFCHLSGTFPRSPELIRATRDFDRGRLEESELERIRKEDVKRLIKYQKDFQYITDGGLLWQDLLRPFTFATGVECGALSRFFKTNTFYRKPVIKGEIVMEPEFLERFYYLDSITDRKKIILPGPVTFHGLSEDRYGENTLFMISRLLACVAEYLIEREAKCIQFSEPYIPFAEDIEFFTWRKSYEILTENLNVNTIIHIPWGDFSNLITLLEFPVKSIGIDFIQTNLEDLTFTTEKNIGIGCIDAENSLVEDENLISGYVRDIVKKLSLHEFYICPNCSLEFLPYNVALNKMELMKKASQSIKE